MRGIARADASRIGRIRRLGGAIAVVCVSAIAGPAAAALDPSIARSDVEALRANDAYAFCDDPRLPLSPSALSLCPDAAEIAGCGGFASACSAAAEGRNRCGPSSAPSTSEVRLPWLGGLAQAIHGFATALIWALVAALGMALLVPVLVALRRSRIDAPLRDDGPGDTMSKPSRAQTESAPPGEAALLSLADRFAAAGQGEVALQLYLAASLSALDRRGAIRAADGRTNGEYVQNCADADDRRRLGEIVREVERVQFGRYDATPQVVAAVARHARTLARVTATAPALTTLMTLALAVAPIVLCACTRGDPACHRLARAGDDPAGLELFYGVLRRQHVHVEPLTQSLASLRPAGDDPAGAPTVVVDLERTALDEETQEHLIQWVRSGRDLVLAGLPAVWPRELGVVATHSLASRRVTVHGKASHDCPEQAPDASCTPAAQPHLAGVAAFELPGDDEGVVASFEDGSIYAARLHLGRGHVLAIASDELLTNAGIARADNAAAMVLLMSQVDPVDVRVAGPHHGVSPPSAPWTSLTRAGLGLGLLHALVASAVVFLAAARRLARPRAAAPPRRRRFVEHVRAVGAVYASTANGAHALSAYTRFAEERLRARMPRGASDIAEFLATRTEQPVERCRALWTRAVAARGAPAPVGDELAVLRDLSGLCAAAIAQDR